MTHPERKKLIKSKGFTQGQLARKINYSRPMLCIALKRGPKDTWYRIQKAVTDALGVDYEQFWNDNPINKGA